MSSFGGNTHAFVIRAWLEPREIPGRPPEWRYSVEHVGSGDRHYLRELSEVTTFMRTHLPGQSPTGWRRQLMRLIHGSGGGRADR
jgi:hypothetical protein